MALSFIECVISELVYDYRCVIPANIQLLTIEECWGTFHLKVVFHGIDFCSDGILSAKMWSVLLNFY